MTKTKKAKLVQQITEELTALVEEMDEGNKATALMLVDNIAFMAAELTALREDITEKGSVMMIENGNRVTSLNANPSVKVYNSMMKIFGQTVSQFKTIVPKDLAAKNRFLEFMKASRPIPKLDPDQEDPAS